MFKKIKKFRQQSKYKNSKENNIRKKLLEYKRSKEEKDYITKYKEYKEEEEEDYITKYKEYKETKKKYVSKHGKSIQQQHHQYPHTYNNIGVNNDFLNLVKV